MADMGTIRTAPASTVASGSLQVRAVETSVSASVCTTYPGAYIGVRPSVTADSDLIARAAAGDAAAFQTLVERHRAMVYRVAYQFAGNHHDAEDIAQEVFIKVFRSLDRFRQDAQLTSWLYRIVMNACIDHRRRMSPSGVAAPGDEAEQHLLNTPEDAPGPEQRAYAGELGQALEAEIARLPPGQRLVFVMRHHQGLKLGEIADALGLAEGTVKRQLHSAVHRLRQALTAVKVNAGGPA
jgi:RNA polymerase sigma-70 factor (ECF subfamily)